MKDKEKLLAKRFGRVVRELRAMAGFSQEGFADLCNLHRTYIGSIERGEKNITIETASRIAEALNVNLSYLFIYMEREEYFTSNDDK